MRIRRIRNRKQKKEKIMTQKHSQHSKRQCSARKSLVSWTYYDEPQTGQTTLARLNKSSIGFFKFENEFAQQFWSLRRIHESPVKLSQRKAQSTWSPQLVKTGDRRE